MELTIEDDVLLECEGNLKIAIVPIGIKKIEAGAFSNCPNLRLICIPDTAVQIANDAFCNCENALIWEYSNYNDIHTVKLEYFKETGIDNKINQDLQEMLGQLIIYEERKQ